MTYVHSTPFVAESKEVYKELKLLELFEQKAQPWAHGWSSRQLTLSTNTCVSNNLVPFTGREGLKVNTF